MDEKELKEQIEKINSAVAEFRTSYLKDGVTKDNLAGDLKDQEKRITDAFTETHYDKQQMDAEIAARKEAEEAILKRQDELQELIGKIGAGDTVSEEKRKEATHHKAFMVYCKSQAQRGRFLTTEERDFLHAPETQALLADVEARDMTEGTDTLGGYLVSPTISNTIREKFIDVDPIRMIAEVVSIDASNDYILLREKDDPDPEHVGELETAAEDEEEYFELSIPTHHIRAVVPVSDTLLQDATNLESNLTRIVGKKFARLEGISFVSGNGIKRAFGITHGIDTDAGVQWATSVTGLGAQLVDERDFARLQVALPNVYWQNARWVLNQTTLGNILNLQDTSGQFLLGFGELSQGLPQTIRTFPYTICNSMPSEGNDVYPLGFGNWMEYYIIVDRIGISMLSDPYTDYPLVKLKFSKRVGGRPVQPDAVKFLKTT